MTPRTSASRTGGHGTGVRRVGARNATFQQWQALLANRTKRQRAGAFLVQGVRPVTLAVERGWRVRDLLHDGRPVPSPWAAALWESTPATRWMVAPELLAELGEKDEGVPELLAVVEIPPDDPARVPAGTDLLAVAFDRPAAPGNLGSLIRSVDALGGSGLFVTGHAADPYDPRCVRASTGSLFGVPVVRTGSHHEVLGRVAAMRAAGVPVTVVGTDETATDPLSGVDLTGPVLFAVGNETSGLTAGWRAACDRLVRIPMARGGAASSLNAANAGTVVLYEATRQRAAG